MTGHVVDFFDNDFREMYAVSEEVDLYKEFSITKPPMPTPVRKPVEKLKVSISRFQVGLRRYALSPDAMLLRYLCADSICVAIRCYSLLRFLFTFLTLDHWEKVESYTSRDCTS